MGSAASTCACMHAKSLYAADMATGVCRHGHSVEAWRMSNGCFAILSVVNSMYLGTMVEARLRAQEQQCLRIDLDLAVDAVLHVIHT